MKKHFPSTQLELVRNSIDTEFFRKELVSPINLLTLNIPKDTFILIHIGRFAEVKNHQLMFKAVELLKLRKAKVALICLGYRGGLWGGYQELITSLQLNDYIYFVGEVDDPRPYIKASDIGLLPSFHEGLSLALLEMFSMELPVLITHIPSSEEVVDGVTEKLFIEMNDPEGLANKIEQIMQNRDEYIQIGREMRKNVIKSFSSIQMAGRYDSIYKKIINQN